MTKFTSRRERRTRPLGHIASKARAAGVVVVEADRREAGRHEPHPCPPGRHRPGGGPGSTSVWRASFRPPGTRGEAPLLVVCDEISDPPQPGGHHPTAECAGAHGVVIPQAPQRGPHRRGGQDLRRSGGPRAGGPGAQHPRSAEGSEKNRGCGSSARRRTAPRPCTTRI